LKIKELTHTWREDEMATELILNGNFSDDFDYWTNDGEGFIPFIEDAGMAMAESSEEGISEYSYRIHQEFTISHLTISGKITVWAKWDCGAGSPQGYAQFIVKLTKPDYTVHTLYDQTKYGQGQGNILNEMDILSYLNQQGNYRLYLYCKIASGWQEFPEPGEYTMSYGWYDNISIKACFRLFHQEFEKFGIGEKPLLPGKVEKESFGYHESYSIKQTFKESILESFGLKELVPQLLVKVTAKEGFGYGPEGYDTNLLKMYQASEVIGYKESYLAKIFKTIKEGFGFKESHSLKVRRQEKEGLGFKELPVGIKIKVLRGEILKFVESHTKKVKITAPLEGIKYNESYSTKTGRFIIKKEMFGYKEKAHAKLFAGNLIIDYDIPLEEPTAWQDKGKAESQWQDKQAQSTSWQDKQKESTGYEDKDKAQTEWQDKELEESTWGRKAKKEE
jgi:hypothetical protein